MKNLFLLLLIFLTFYACQEPIKTTKYEAIQTIANEPKKEEVTSDFDQQKELESIMKVIEGETKCFAEDNYDCWKNHWLQEKSTCITYNTKDGSFVSKIGWNIINKDIGGLIIDKPIKTDNSSIPTVTRKNMEVKFFGPTAVYIAWQQDQINQDRDFIQGHETRILEKVNENWKLVHISIFWDYKSIVSLKDILDDNGNPVKLIKPMYEL